MSLRVIIVIFVCVANLKVAAQQYFADYLIAGTSLTYMQNTSKDVNQNLSGYTELTWNVNLGMRLNKKFVTGIQLLNIYSAEVSKKKDYYNIYGVFTQFNFFRKREEHRLFAEVSINRGNYDLCGELPTYEKEVHYLGLGAGLDLPLNAIQNLYLDLSFIGYLNIKSFLNNCAYTQYVIGFNYRFNHKR